MSIDIVIEPLTKKHRRQDFDCGEESLNTFLKNFARQNDERGLGKTFVAVRPGEMQILGYYTISSGSVSFEIFRSTYLGTRSRRPILAALQ